MDANDISRVMEGTLLYVKHKQRGVGEIDSKRKDGYTGKHKVGVKFPVLDLLDDQSAEQAFLHLEDDTLSVPTYDDIIDAGFEPKPGTY